jgi:hypothetical protein
MSIEKSVGSLIARWRKEGVEILPPADRPTVMQAFEAVGSLASGEIVALFALLGGMSEMDNEYWKMWSLQEISEANRVHSNAGVLFSDYCMDCYQYRLKPIDELVSEVWVEGFDFGPPVLIASSLSEFFEAYISNPDSVLNAPLSRSEYALSAPGVANVKGQST